MIYEDGKIKYNNPSIIVFFVDKHFTTAVVEDDDIYYFDSYGEVDPKVKKMLRRFSMDHSEEEYMNIHVNKNVWQDDNPYCGVYSFVFLYSMLHEDESFEESATFDQDDKE